VEDNGDVVSRSNRANVVGGSDSSGHTCFLSVVGDTLSWTHFSRVLGSVTREESDVCSRAMCVCGGREEEQVESSRYYGRVECDSGTHTSEESYVEGQQLLVKIRMGMLLTGSSLGCLQDDGRLLVTGSLEGGYDGGRRGDVDGRDGIALLLSVLEAKVTGTKSVMSHNALCTRELLTARGHRRRR
jgi:hypothetical protein